MIEAIFNRGVIFNTVESMGPYHPILPAELWSRVFTFSVNDWSYSRDAILRVNRTFRFIANRTPQLWTQISIRSRQDILDPCRMKAKLQKSGALPLNVYISLEDVNIQPLAKYMRKHVSRFQTLHLKLESAQFTAEFLSVMGQDCPAPLLQRLILEVFKTEEEVDIEDIIVGSIFHPSPRLEYLSIPQTLFPAVTNSTLLPTVKDFTYAGDNSFNYEIDVGPDEVFDVLSQTPLLESFTIRTTENYSEGRYDSLLPYFVVMPHLLSVDVTVPGTGLGVLSAIRSPLLQRVCLDGYHCYFSETDSVEQLSQLIGSALRRLSQHSPKIIHLELVHIEFNDPEVTYPWIMGSGFPSLEMLNVTYCNITDDALRLCKPLKMKRFELEYCKHLTRDGILHVIEDRGSDFELKINQCRNISQDDVVVLSDVVKVEYAEYTVMKHYPMRLILD